MRGCATDVDSRRQTQGVKVWIHTLASFVVALFVRRVRLFREFNLERDGIVVAIAQFKAFVVRGEKTRV